MKKILFMCINMNIGGTEKALLTMLNEMDSNKYDITLLMLEQYGGFLSEIPNFVKIEYINDYKNIKSFIKDPPKLLLKRLIKGKKYINGISMISIYTISKLTRNMNYYYKYILRSVKKLDEEYDLAVAYAGPMDFITYFILNKIEAKKKAQWIHFDVTKIGFNIKFAEKNYKKFDKIFVVSEEAKEKLQKYIPELEEKTEVFTNIVNYKEIKRKSNEFKAFNDKVDDIKLLTVGRLTKQKGQDMIPRILKRLINDGYNIRWYCIGEGYLKDELNKKIKENELENRLILLGKKLNPYPYFKECDVYVQPSRYEGFCITLAEAKIFRKPIIITDFVGSEQIKNNETGIIVRCNEDDIYNSIKSIINNKDTSNLFIENLGKEIFNSSREIDKIYKLIEL